MKLSDESYGRVSGKSLIGRLAVHVQVAVRLLLLCCLVSSQARRLQVTKSIGLTALSNDAIALYNAADKFYQDLWYFEQDIPDVPALQGDARQRLQGAVYLAYGATNNFEHQSDEVKAAIAAKANKRAEEPDHKRTASVPDQTSSTLYYPSEEADGKEVLTQDVPALIDAADNFCIDVMLYKTNAKNAVSWQGKNKDTFVGTLLSVLGDLHDLEDKQGALSAASSTADATKTTTGQDAAQAKREAATAQTALAKAQKRASQGAPTKKCAPLEPSLCGSHVAP